MANVKLNPVFDGFSKQIGDLVFVNSHGKTYVRRKAIPRQANSETQLRHRALFREIASAWKVLDADNRQRWEEAARGRNMSGYNRFIKENMKRRRSGQDLALSPESL